MDHRGSGRRGADGAHRRSRARGVPAPGRERARRTGALWAGLAQFDAAETHQAGVVHEALAGVGGLYGGSFSPRGGSQRPVGGVLFIFPDRLYWEPRIWLGRGKARSWELPTTAIVGVETVKMPPPAIRGYTAVLHTTGGDVHFGIVDPDGLRYAVTAIQRLGEA